MDELEKLKEEIELLEKVIVPEEAIESLQKFLFIYKMEMSRNESTWTKDEKTKAVVEALMTFIEENKSDLQKYFELNSQYKHMFGEKIGIGHTHNGHTHTHYENEITE